MMRIARISWLIVLAAGACSASAADIADFAKHPQYKQVKISPNGEYLAVTTIINDKTALGLIHLADMKGQNLGAREGAEIAGFDWVSPDRVMYTVGEHWGGKDQSVANGELYTVKGDGTDAALVFGYRAAATMTTASHIKQADIDFAIGGLIAPLLAEPNYALISSYAFNGPDHSDSFIGAFPEGYKIDLRDGKKTRIVTSPLRRAEFLADHEGVIRFAFGTDADQWRKVYYRASGKADWEQLWDEGKGAEGFMPILFDRGNKAVYAHCGSANLGGICRWDTATRKLTSLWSSKDSSVAELVETFDGLDAFAIRTMPGRPAVVLLDKSAPEATLLVTLMKQFPGEDIQFASATRDGKKVVFLAQADADPGIFYLYDADKKKASALLERRRWIKPEQMASMEPVLLKSRDGIDLHGYLTKPPGKETAKNLPTVVFVHGGPYGMRDEWGFDPEVQLLASHGYAVLQVNFRGSGGYGLDFEKAGYREWGGRMQDDVTDATRWAVAQGVADPKRVCIFGASYGGYAALEGAVKEPDLYKCAIGYVGVYDLRLMHSRGDTTQSAFGVNFLKKVLGEDESDLWNRSPIAHLDALKAKVMLIVGGEDRRVPPIQGENLHNALLKNKIDHEWVYERSEGHGFYNEQHTSELYLKIIAFLDREIGAKAAVAAAK
jgi:dipeptidyl aminopeptidase/acylaminoacyl peptidase